MNRSWVLASTLILGLVSADFARAQNEKKPDTQPAKKADKGGGSAKEQYEAQLEEWKSLLKELRKLKTEYQTAPEDKVDAMKEKWNSLITQGEDMIGSLREKGLAAYQEAPNADRQLSRFLSKIANDDLNKDRYADSLKVAKAMIEQRSGQRELLRVAGIAAFALHDFETAEKHLQAAFDAGTLKPEEEAKFYREVKAYKRFWGEEKAARKKEEEADDLPRVRITTTKGEIIIELFENEAPGTVGNFVSLVDKKFYDGLTFHRVLGNFMAQGGCPIGDGTGGPEYRIYDELTGKYRKHFRGSLSMANSGPDSGGSQFFILFNPAPYLNGKHTVFGRVVKGLDVLERLQRIDPMQTTGVPPKPDKIVKAEMIRKRDHKYVPNKVE